MELKTILSLLAPTPTTLMEAWKLLLFILHLIISTTTNAQFSFRHSVCGDDTGTYTPNSTYHTNLQTVLNSLSSDTKIRYGFYNFTAGEIPDKVSSLALCRGDIPVGTCRTCINNSATLLPQVCTNQKQAFGYSDYCSIFISNLSIYGQVQNFGELPVLTSHQNFPDLAGYNKTVYNLLHKLRDQSASGNAERKFATGKLNISSTGSVLYGLVQCTPDLSRSQCVSCVQESLDQDLPGCCTKDVSPFVLMKPSCRVQYDTTQFYGNVPDIAPPPPRYTNSTPIPSIVTHRRSHSSIIIIVVPTVVGIATLIIGTIIFVFMKRTRGKLEKSRVDFNEDEINTLKSLQFSLKEIKHATQEFAANNKLGQGGFGIVYKGVLSDGQEIAVKRLGKNSAEEGDVQFKNEILILAKLQHRNLVRLLGYCLHKQEMLLVFELMPNRSLDNFLFDPLQRESMVWETRYKIINGISRGLLYLHEESRLRIIHRDLKAANVLLDSKFNPKIADFGMARLFSIDQTRAVASNIAGTFGYMPPEYVFQGQVSMKLDVYSFGVLIIEIISGQRINKFHTNEDNPEDLLNFAWKCWKNETATSDLIDSALSKSDGLTNKDEILRCIQIGLLCVQHNPIERPSMSTIDSMLRSNSPSSLRIPSQPALFTSQNNVRSDDGCSVNLVTVSMNEVYPR